MFRTFDRYLLKSFITNYLLALFVMISLYVVLDLFVNFDEFTESKQPLWMTAYNILDYYGYNLPLYFSQLSGVIVLFAGCMTFTRLHRQNEVIAMLASGTSIHRLAMPIIAAGFGMNMLLMLDQEFVLPRIAPKLVRARDDIEGRKPYEVWCVRDGDSRLINALQFSPAQKGIRGLVILELDTDEDTKGQLKDVITADLARWDDTRRGWVLERGIRHSMSGSEAGLLGADSAAQRTSVSFYETTLNPDQLKLRQTVQWMQFLSIQQLRELEASGDVNVAQVAPLKHSRFTLPINNMILLLLGLSCYMTRSPSSVLTIAAKALVLCASAFIFTFVAQQLVSNISILSPAVPAWLPIFIFGPIVVLLLENAKT